MATRALSRAVWALSLPIVMAHVSETIAHVTDTIFLAHVGLAELGAIALADSIYEVLMVIPIGLADGILILAARRAGQGREAAMGQTFNHGLLLVVGCSLVLSAALRLGAPWLTGALMASPEVGRVTSEFLVVIALGLVFHSVNIAYDALLVALERTAVLIPATILLTATNTLLDYGLIFGHFGLPRMGMAGTAWGSVGAELLTFLFLTGYVLRRVDTRRYGLFRFGRLDPGLLRLLWAVSYPVALRMLVEGARWFSFFVLIERLGPLALATSNVIYSFYAVLKIPTEGFADAACSMVSRVIGRGQGRRIGIILWSTISPTYLVTLPLAIIACVAPGPLVATFADEPGVVEGCVGGVRLVGAAMLVMIPAEMWFTAVTGTGDTGVALVIEIAMAIAMVAGAALAGPVLGLGLVYVWMSVPLSWMLCLLLSYGWMRAGRWRRLAI